MKKIAGLDYIRVFAFGGVLLYHIFFRGPIEGNLYNPMLFNAIYFYGYYGVDIFFILSGYLIYRSISTRSIFDFIYSRIKRILPTFILCSSIVLFTSIYWAYSSTGNFSGTTELIKKFLISFTFIWDIFGITPLSAVYWTLAIEVRFYILAALATAIIRKSNGKICKEHFIIIWYFVAFINAIYFHNNYMDSILLLNYVGHFTFGLLLSTINISNKEEVRNAIPLLAISSLFILRLFVGYKSLINYLFSIDIEEMNIFAYFCFVLVIFISLCNREKVCFLDRIMSKLSSWSFAFYLLHADLIGFFLNKGFPLLGSYVPFILTISYRILTYIAIIISLLEAAICTYIINQLTKKLRTRKVNGKP